MAAQAHWSRPTPDTASLVHRSDISKITRPPDAMRRPLSLLQNGGQNGAPGKPTDNPLPRLGTLGLSDVAERTHASENSAGQKKSRLRPVSSEPGFEDFWGPLSPLSHSDAPLSDPSLSPSLSRSLSNLVPRETLAGLRSSGEDHSGNHQTRLFQNTGRFPPVKAYQAENLFYAQNSSYS